MTKDDLKRLAEARYRKKPVVIDAWQWDGKATAPERPKWLRGPNVIADHSEETLDIQTLEGLMTARVGDWVIRGVKGELYPCKPDIFAATYEPALEAPAVTEDAKVRCHNCKSPVDSAWSVCRNCYHPIKPAPADAQDEARAVVAPFLSSNCGMTPLGHKLTNAIATALSAKQAEIDALKHDIERHLQICSDQVAEIDRLTKESRTSVTAATETIASFENRVADLKAEIASAVAAEREACEVVIAHLPKPGYVPTTWWDAFVVAGVRAIRSRPDSAPDAQVREAPKPTPGGAKAGQSVGSSAAPPPFWSSSGCPKCKANDAQGVGLIGQSLHWTCRACGHAWEQTADSAPNMVLVPRTTLEWIKRKTADKRNPAVAFVCDKLLKGEEFSVLRENDDA